MESGICHLSRLHSNVVCYSYCKPSDSLTSHPYRGTAVLPNNWTNETTRQAVGLYVLSICLIHLEELFIIICGQDVLPSHQDRMQQGMPFKKVVWNQFFSRNVWGFDCAKRKFHILHLFMIAPMPFTVFILHVWTGQYTKYPFQQIRIYCVNVSDKQLFKYTHVMAPLNYRQGPAPFKVTGWLHSFFWNHITLSLMLFNNSLERWIMRICWMLGIPYTTWMSMCLCLPMLMMLQGNFAVSLRKSLQKNPFVLAIALIMNLHKLGWGKTETNKNTSRSLLGLGHVVSTKQCLWTIWCREKFVAKFDTWAPHIHSMVLQTLKWKKGLSQHDWDGWLVGVSGPACQEDNPIGVNFVSFEVWCTPPFSLVWRLVFWTNLLAISWIPVSCGTGGNSCRVKDARNLNVETAQLCTKRYLLLLCGLFFVFCQARMNFLFEELSGISPWHERLLYIPYGSHVFLELFLLNLNPQLMTLVIFPLQPTLGRNNFIMTYTGWQKLKKVTSFFLSWLVSHYDCFKIFEKISFVWMSIFLEQFLSVFRSHRQNINQTLCCSLQLKKRQMKWMRLSNVNVWRQMVHSAQRHSALDSAWQCTFPTLKGVHMDTYLRIANWWSQINVLFADMYSAACAPRKGMCVNLCWLAIVVVWVVKPFFTLSPPKVWNAGFAAGQLQLWIRCLITWLNMCSGKGFKIRSVVPTTFHNMDQWELRSSHAEQPAKKMAVGHDKQQVSRALHLIGRLCLKNALEVRELQAAVFHTFLVPKRSDYVQAPLAATKEFADKAKRAKEGKCALPPGEPHVHAWAAMLRVALEDPALGDSDKQAIQNHRNTATDPDAMSRAVFVCKIRKAFDRDTMKVFFSVHRDVEPALKAVIKGITAHGGKQKVGQAPRSGLERDVQDVIDELTAVLGDK